MATSRLRLLMAAMAAVFAVSAAGAASASAAECPDTVKGGDVALCVEGHEQSSGTVPFTSKIAPGTVATFRTASGIVIVCKKAENTGQIEAEDHEPPPPPSFLEISDLEIVFSECKVTSNEANCEVVEPISVNGGGDNLDGTFTGENTEDVVFAPSEGTTFVTLTIKSKSGHTCLQAVKAKVTGTQECNVVSPETEAVTHELKCEGDDSNLEFAGSKAEFEVHELVTLTSGKTWGIYKS